MSTPLNPSDISESEMSNFTGNSSDSPRRRRADTIHKNQPPQRARKRARLHEAENAADEDVVFAVSNPDATAPTAVLPSNSTTPATFSASTHNSLKLIQEEAHANRLELRKQMEKGKGTEKSYPRHVKNYLEFWADDQARRAKLDPNYVMIPAHPIVGEKVALFLHYESTRGKRDNRRNDKGGTVGSQSIAQVISALQHYVVHHQHEPAYANCAETRIPLRSQSWVKSYETAASANKPTRLQEAHDLKAKGRSNDIYTADELIRMSLWTLRAFGPGATQIHTGLRDRAMLLLSTTIAFRGDSTRLLMLSDLFFRSLPMGTIGADVKLQTLGIIADQSKTNVTGRVDEHGLFRHRIPELCGFGAIGFYLFSHFHILGKTVNFAPNFDDPAYGEYGQRDWYKLFAFPGKGDQPEGMNPMSYHNHRDRVATMHERNSVDISAITHGGRSYTASTAREHGATAVDTKVLGRWSTGDAYSEVYDRGLPKPAMLAAAMFSADNPTAYVLPRGLLVPPSELPETIFPWAENELSAYYLRLKEHGMKATDYALKNFLKLLIELRCLILQDAAVLYVKYPDLNLWKYAPFNNPSFIAFAKESTAIIEHAEISARQRLENLPQTVSTSMQGILQTLHIQQMQDRSDFSQRFEFMEGLLMSQLTSTAKGRKVAEQFVVPRERSRSVNVQRSISASPNIPITPSDTPKPSFQGNIMNKVDCAPAGGPALDAEATLHAHFRLSPDEYEQGLQLTHIEALKQKYGQECLLKHQFSWMTYPSGAVREEFLPFYTYRNGLSIRQIWEEWADGLDGRLSVRQLNEGWGARWRRNVPGQKTEASRRKHLIDLINTLSQKPNWTTQLALKFLEDEYPIPRAGFLASTTAFCRHLQNKANGELVLQGILDKSSIYCKK